MAYSPEILDEIVKAQDQFVWEAPAWEFHPRGPRWYVIMSIIAIGFVIYAIVTGNFLFAFLIMLMAIMLVLSGSQSPQTVLIQIGENGLVIDGKFHEYKELSNFSIVYQPPETKVLYIEQASILRPRLRLFLEDQNPLEIRSHLKQYLEENLVLQEEHLSDIVGRLLKI